MAFIQGSLNLDPSIARKSDPDTSKKAAKKINSGSIRAAILHLLDQSAGRGLTTYEIADTLNVRRDVISPHLRPMARQGIVKDAGRRINHNSPSKNECIVWNVTDLYYQKFHGTFSGKTLNKAVTIKICPTCGQEVK